MKQKVYFFGDIHFSAMHPWLIETGDKFIDWFMKTYDSSHNNDYIVFLGDITDKHVNPGGVVKQAFKLFDHCNKTFKKTYVLTGNHDKKLYRDVVQSSLDFLNCFENVHVIEEVEQIKIENRTLLCLPHIRAEGKSLSDYYNDYDWQAFESSFGKSDVGIGHWAIQDSNFMFSKIGVDISKIPANKWVVGHIHTRPTPVYTGSIWPCNHTEQECNYPRCIKEWELETNTWTEVSLPTFIEYKMLNYPDPVQENDSNIVTVYTVNGIRNKTEAQNFYKGSYIKDIRRELQNNDLEDISTSNEIFLYKDNKEALDAMIKETKISISRSVFSIINNIL